MVSMNIGNSVVCIVVYLGPNLPNRIHTPSVPPSHLLVAILPGGPPLIVAALTMSLALSVPVLSSAKPNILVRTFAPHGGLADASPSP